MSFLDLLVDIGKSIWGSREVIFGALLASGVISVVLQKFKKWFELQSDKVVIFLNMVLCFLVACGNYLLGTPAQNPKVLAVQTFLLVGMNTPIYRYLVKPATNLLIDAKAERERRETGVPAVPVDTVVTPTTPPSDEFTG